jgi:hypothetical protein
VEISTSASIPHAWYAISIANDGTNSSLMVLGDQYAALDGFDYAEDIGATITNATMDTFRLGAGFSTFFSGYCEAFAFVRERHSESDRIKNLRGFLRSTTES